MSRTALLPDPVVRRIAFLAALVTLVAAAGLDIAAGQRLLHAIPLGVVAALVGALRIRFAGLHRGVFAVVSGAIVVQPALHFGMTVATPHPGNGQVDIQHLLGKDAPITAGHALIAGIVIGVVMASERVSLRLASALQRTVRRLMPSPQPGSPGPAVPPTTRAIRPVDVWVGHLARRGPPGHLLLPQGPWARPKRTSRVLVAG